MLDSTAQAALMRKLAAQAPVETSVPDAARAELARAAVGRFTSGRRSAERKHGTACRRRRRRSGWWMRGARVTSP
ncbi:hypothetical protein V6L77_00835 [Pannonibacter sp. Pt2-lr]